jgi:tetratricopeptide (TPR) repeat protein
LMRTARVRNVTTHTLHILDFGQSATDRPIPALALRLLGVEADADQHERAEAVERAVAQGMLLPEDRVHACELVAAALGDEPAARFAAMDAATRHGGRARVLRHLLEHASATPLVLAVEDVHWAAGDEIAQLADLATSVAARPVLIALTSRATDGSLVTAWRTRGWGSPITTLDLAPLAEDEARELASTHEGLPADMIERCLQTALGHPLFLEHLLRAARAGQTAMPGSVRGLVLARIERLPAQLQHALHGAAILGLRFPQDALRHVLGDPHYLAYPLEQAGLVALEGEECRFAHALIRDAIYESLLGSTRRTLHRRAASWYEARDAGLQADHLAAADDSAAAAAYVRAAVESHGAYRVDRALSYAQRALETARESDVLCEALATRGDIELAAGRTSDACHSFRRCVELAGHGPMRARAWLGVATSLRIMDRYDEALQAIAKAEAEVDAGDAKRLAQLWTMRGNLYFPRGELELCFDAHGKALDFARRAGSVEDIARALGGLGDAHYQRGRMRSALDHFRQCVELAEGHGLIGLRLAYVPMVAVSEIYMGNFEPAYAMCASAGAAAFEVGDRRARLLSANILASIELSRGHYAASLTWSDTGHALAIELGARRFEAEALVLRGLAQLGSQEHATALRTLDAAAALSREACPTYCAPWAFAALALASTDRSQIDALLAEGEQLLSRDCVSHNYLEFYHLGIEVGLRAGDLQRTQKYAAALEAYTHDEPLPWSALVIRRARALVSAARDEGGTDAALRAALSEARTMQWESLVPELQAAIDRLSTRVSSGTA